MAVTALYFYTIGGQNRLMGNESSKTKQKQAEPGDIISIPNIVELWKELYFNTEELWATTTKELIASKSFINLLDQIRDQSLSLYKVSQQNIDQYLEVNPLPSKKDIARIAELVIGLEDKIDDFDLHFASDIANNLSKLASSMLKLVEYQEFMKQEILELKRQTDNINNRFETVNRKLDNINKRFDTINKKLNAMARAQAGTQEDKSEDNKPATTSETE